MKQLEAIQIVKAYKELLSQHLEFEAVYLFGSHALNTSVSDSDIDVAVFVDGMDVNPLTTEALLWKVRRSIDTRIEPLLIDSSDTNAPIFSDIRQNGIKI